MASFQPPPLCRFPAPTGRRSADVAAVVAWRRHVLAFLATNPAAQALTEATRAELRRRELPDLTGDPTRAYERIQDWRNNFANWCALVNDLIHDPDSHEWIPDPSECAAMSAFLDPGDGRPRCEYCLEAPHQGQPPHGWRCPLLDRWEHPSRPPNPGFSTTFKTAAARVLRKLQRRPTH